MARKRKGKGLLLTIAAILVATASWAFYGLINQGATDLLLLLGITNAYAQSFTVIVFVLVLLGVVGFGFKKTWKKILNL